MICTIYAYTSQGTMTKIYKTQLQLPIFNADITFEPTSKHCTKFRCTCVGLQGHATTV